MLKPGYCLTVLTSGHLPQVCLLSTGVVFQQGRSTLCLRNSWRRCSGSPIGRRVKRHRRSCENFFLFPFSPRDLCDSLIDAPLFSISWCRTFWSAPVTHQVQGCGRCPLRAAISRPWQTLLPQKTIGTTPRPRLTDHRSTDSPCSGANPIVAHGVGVHRITAPPSCLYDQGRDSVQIGPCGCKPTRTAKAHYPIPTVKL